MLAHLKSTRWIQFVLVVPFTFFRSAVLALPVQPSVIRNLARGSTLKIMADLSGGLPMEVWKSSVVLESIRFKQGKRKRRTSKQVLQDLVEERGIQGLWTGCSARRCGPRGSDSGRDRPPRWHRRGSVSASAQWLAASLIRPTPEFWDAPTVPLV